MRRIIIYGDSYGAEIKDGVETRWIMYKPECARHPKANVYDDSGTYTCASCGGQCSVRRTQQIIMTKEELSKAFEQRYDYVADLSRWNVEDRKAEWLLAVMRDCDKYAQDYAVSVLEGLKDYRYDRNVTIGLDELEAIIARIRKEGE